MTRAASRMLLLIAWVVLAGLSAGVTQARPAEPLTVVEAGSARLLGSATAIGGRHVVTNRHVIALAERRGVDVALSLSGRTIAARIGAVSDRLDLALLVAGEPLGNAPTLGPWPLVGTTVEARSPAGAWVDGRVVAHPWREAWGPALFVRLPARFGFSGGPVFDASGGLVGLVTAAVNPTADELLALRVRSGPAGGDMATVLVLPIAPVLAEVERLMANRR